MSDQIWVNVSVGNSQNLKRRFSVRAFVDNGSMDSAMPASLLRGIGVKPRGRDTYEAWAGKTHRRSWGEADFRLQGKFGTCRVTFEPEDEVPTIGALTLETLGFNIDMIHGVLRPALRFGRGPRRRKKQGLR